MRRQPVHDLVAQRFSHRCRRRNLSLGDLVDVNAGSDGAAARQHRLHHPGDSLANKIILVKAAIMAGKLHRVQRRGAGQRGHVTDVGVTATGHHDEEVLANHGQLRGDRVIFLRHVKFRHG